MCVLTHTVLGVVSSGEVFATRIKCNQMIIFLRAHQEIKVNSKLQNEMDEHIILKAR